MYSQAVFLLTGLSIAAATLSQEPSHQSHPTEWMLVSTTTVNETIVLTCPPAPTVWVSVTQYVPVTTTTTDTDFETDTTTTSIWNTTTLPITIYQTIISTTTLTTTEIVTETSTTVSPTTATATATSVVLVPTTATETSVTISPTTATETSIVLVPTTATETSITISLTTATETSITVSPTTATETSTTISPLTLTATEELLLSTLTQRVTSVTLCPTRIANPTYTALGPYPTDWTWGCPPGWLCKPTRENCNFEAGIPDRNFLCPPDQCAPAEVLPVPLATWDDTIYGNSSPALNAGLTVQALDNYFNMDPLEFGLSYEIFVIEETITLTATTIRPPSPTIGARQAQTSVPGACFPWCNNCLLEAQANGKTPALCVPGSAFETSLEQCEQCIEVHRTDDSGSFVQIAPQFQQFLDYCDQFSTVVVTTSVVATTTNTAGSTLTSMSSILSTTVTPRTSSSAPPTGPQTSTSTATVAPTVTTVMSTSYSESTVTGDAWSSATIILPLENNSTTTIYGSDLTDGATLVLPVAQTTSSYISTLGGGTAPVGASSSASAAGSGTTSQFSGTASRGKSFFSEGLHWWTLVLGVVIPLWLAVSL